MKSSKSFRYNKGVTFIELMIALMLFAVVMLGMSTMFTVAPTQHSYHMNALTIDIYKLSSLLTSDLLSATGVTSPADPGTSGFSTASILNITVSDNSTASGTSAVTYQLAGNKIQRCKNGGCEDLLSSWDNGEIRVVGSSTPFRRGVDVDGSGFLSNRERNLIQITMALGKFEDESGTLNETERHTFLLEVIVGSNTPI